MKDLLSGVETQITTNTEHQLNPSIYGDRIVWEDNRNVNMDIFMKNLLSGVETQLTTSTADQYHVAIYGDNIVYADNWNLYCNIFMKNLTTGLETMITARNDSSSQHPAIYGDHIIWENDRSANWDIYGTDGSIFFPEISWVPELAAGASIIDVATVTLPADLTAGDKYYIGAVLDYTNIIDESNELNNLILDSTPLNVVLPTEIVVNPISGIKEDTVNLVATLKDSENIPLQGKNIQFTVDGTIVGTSINRCRWNSHTTLHHNTKLWNIHHTSRIPTR